MLARYLSSLLYLMELEKTHSHATSVGFFRDYAGMNNVYVPADYVLRAIGEAHSHDALAADLVLAFAQQFVGENSMADEASCIAAAKKGQVVKKAALSARLPVPGPLLDRTKIPHCFRRC